MNNLNEQLPNLLQKKYWLNSMKKLKETKSIVLASIFIAMMIVVNIYGVLLNIELLGNKVYFEYIPAAICSLVLGPIIGIMAGAISDIVGFIIMPGGYPFFFGYTISAILSSLIYALFLHSTKITISKIIGAKLTVNLFVNVFLGSLWRVMMINNYSLYWKFFSLSITKNLIILPFEVAILFLILKYLIPISKTMQILNPNIPSEIKFL